MEIHLSTSMHCFSSLWTELLNSFWKIRVRARTRIRVTWNRVDRSSNRNLQWAHWCVEVSITKATIHALTGRYLEVSPVSRLQTWLVTGKCHFFAHRTWYFREVGGQFFCLSYAPDVWSSTTRISNVSQREIWIWGKILNYWNEIRGELLIKTQYTFYFSICRFLEGDFISINTNMSLDFIHSVRLEATVLINYIFIKH